MNELFDAHNSVCLSDFAVDCGLRPNLPPADDVAIRNVRIVTASVFIQDTCNKNKLNLGMHWSTERHT